MFPELSVKTREYLELDPDVSVETLCQAELIGRKIIAGYD
jgi:hypothetical protein